MISHTNKSRALLVGAPAILAAGFMAVAMIAPQPRTARASQLEEVAGSAAHTEANGTWRIKATDALIVGGYGDNFAYDGMNVRAVEGHAEMTVVAGEGKAKLEIEIKTNEDSGPIQFSSDEAWSGKIRIVQMIDTSEMDMARIAEHIELHGDTGNEAPVMPKIFSYFATWGPSQIWVNGEEVIPMIGSHTMFSERARNAQGAVVDGSGKTYSPMAQEKSGFADPSETEFHFVAHTTQPDGNNFPPHTAWIHLNFAKVEVKELPDGAQVPYEQQ